MKLGVITIHNIEYEDSLCTCIPKRPAGAPNHNFGCPYAGITLEKEKCSACGHTMDVDWREDEHWYKNHYRNCPDYGICMICRADVHNGEPHEKKLCIFIIMYLW